ncbi:MAG: LptF/LptG family permease [Candidatus Zixiibacteriota bacterium]
MIKKLDRYLLKNFFASLAVVTVAIGLTIIVINMVEELQDFVDHKVPILRILEYYLYFGGWVVKSFLPMFVLLALLFSISMLARKREILAMKASGLSLYRIALPFLLAACLLAVGHFYYSEYLFPPLNQRRVEIKEFDIDKKSKEARARVHNVYRLISPGYFYTISNFDTERGEGQEFRLYKTGDGTVERLVTAERVRYVDFRWTLERGIDRHFDRALEGTFSHFDTLSVIDIQDKPADLARKIADPVDMGIDDLRQYIDLMKRTGGPHTRESIDYKLKFSYPVTTIIIVLICVPFASNPRRSGIAVSFATGAAIALVYFILFRVMQSAGYNEKIPDYIAVWGVNVVFALIGLVLMAGARK